MIIPKETLTR